MKPVWIAFLFGVGAGGLGMFVLGAFAALPLIQAAERTIFAKVHK